MRAVTWQGRRNVSVDDVPDPVIKEATDAIIRVTSTNICGSDLHLYEVLGAFMTPGDILGHEAMGVVEAVGRETGDLQVGDRVVIPFNISCGHCFMCGHGLQSQCETTQNRDQGTGAALFGYSKLYGEVPGGQAEYLRVPQAQYTHIKVPHDGPDERYVYLSDVLPTAWQAVEYANVPQGGTLVILGMGPIGSMACRVARQRHDCRVIGVDMVPERIQRAREMCSDVIDMNLDDPVAVVRDSTEGRGADSVIDAVGMEAHGSPIAEAAQTAAAFLPSPIGRVRMKLAGIRCLRRRRRPDQHDDVVRQAGESADGAGQRQALGARHPSAADRRRSARHRGVRNAPLAAQRRTGRIREVPEETGRHGQGGADALTGG
jgi:threonine dehydrogenase-like Zn-dependent dehydrogenase